VSEPEAAVSGRRSVSKRLVWVLAAQAGVFALLGAEALDLYSHRKLVQMGGVNVWGYRGPVAHAKRPREVRIALVGGTRAYGWGMVASATTAPAIYTRMQLVMDRPGTDPPPLVVLNLGRPGGMAADYPVTIEHYASLQPDYICLYDDLGAPDIVPEWSSSGVFALTGYMPMLPLVLGEKGRLLRSGTLMQHSAGGLVSDGPSVASRAAGFVLETAGTVLMAADHKLGEMVRRDRPDAATRAPYSEQLQAAIDSARRHARGVVVAIGPVELEAQRRNLEAIGEVRQRCATSPWCRFVDLGTIPKLTDNTLRLDSWNYGGEATWAVAEAIAPALLDLIGYH
jgi:hypothetical protein